MHVQPQRNRFLSSLAARESSLFKPYLVEVALKAGQQLHRSGEPIEQIYFPHTASVSIGAATTDGIAIQGALIGREGIIGGLTALGLNEALNGATILIPGSASRIAVEKFRGALDQSDERMRDWIIRAELSCMAQAQQAATCNALHSAEQRLCRHLLELDDRVDGRRIPITQAALAAMLGIQRTTVTLVSCKLQKDKALLCRRGHIHLLDRAAIERSACDCYSQVRERLAYLWPVPEREVEEPQEERAARNEWAAAPLPSPR